MQLKLIMFLMIAAFNDLLVNSLTRQLVYYIKLNICLTNFLTG